MFARPRPKKSVLSAPPSRKRKATHTVEEINFDDGARSEYLTGFHKRKLQRAKHAQEEAAKKARQEKVDFRKQVREGRQRGVEEHVQNVKNILKQAERAGHIDEQGVSDSADEAWDGFQDNPIVEPVDREEEYVDEDRFTTVTVESVNVSRDGLRKTDQSDSEEEPGEDAAGDNAHTERGDNAAGKRSHPSKKKPKFRYESKFDRRVNSRKEKAKKKRKPI